MRFSLKLKILRWTTKNSIDNWAFSSDSVSGDLLAGMPGGGSFDDNLIISAPATLPKVPNAGFEISKPAAYIGFGTAAALFVSVLVFAKATKRKSRH